MITPTSLSQRMERKTILLSEINSNYSYQQIEIKFIKEPNDLEA